MTSMTEAIPPPDAEEAPAGAPVLNALDKRFNSDTDLTNRVGQFSDTAKFIAGRERILGRLTVHREATIAAGMVLQAMGPIRARAWARELLAELEVQR